MKYLPIAAMLVAASLAHAETSQNPGKVGEQTTDTTPKLAVKLAGLVIFVANSCPQIKPDYERFKTVVSQLGVKVEDLSKDDLKIETLNYASIYQKDPDGSCGRAASMFGAKGSIIPGVFIAK